MWMTYQTLHLTSAVMSSPSASRHTRQGVAQEIPHLVPNKLHLEQLATSPWPAMQHMPELLSPSNTTILLPRHELALIQYYAVACKSAGLHEASFRITSVVFGNLRHIHGCNLRVWTALAGSKNGYSIGKGRSYGCKVTKDFLSDLQCQSNK